MKEPLIRPERRDGHRRSPIQDYEMNAARGLSRVFREAIKLPENHTHYYEHGFRSGSLHESNLWQIAANIDNARPFSLLETIDVPDFHIGLLVDCSGSMSQGTEYLNGIAPYRYDVSVMNSARILALGMGIALSDRQGIHLSVCGHTEESGNILLSMVKRGRSEFNPDNFAALSAQSGNLDGPAMVAFAREMAKDMRNGEPGMLVLISDGAPCHSPNVMRQAIDICKRQNNITVFPIGVADDLDDDTCKLFYGPGNYILARDVLSAAPVISTRANLLIEELKPM